MRSFLFGILFLLSATGVAFAQCVPISTFPYHEDFEANQGGWQSGGANNDWAWGAPTKPVVNAAGSGTKCWVTGGLTGSFYSFAQRSYVESPCFDFTNLPHPYIHFKIWWESERHFDGTNLQYSLDGGATWSNVGKISDTTDCLNANWYNYSPINFLTTLATVRDGWSGNLQPTIGICVGGFGSGNWVEAKHCMPYLAGQASVRFRFTFGAGTTCNDFDGVAFDDIYIENAPPIVSDFTSTCSGANTYSFTDNSTNCPETWTWNFGDPASGASNTATGQNPSHTYNTPGTYTVSMNAASLCSGNSALVTHTVTIIGLTTQISPVHCNGANDGSATVQLSPPANMPSFQWSTSPVQTTGTAVNLAPGSYTVTVSEPGVCPATASITITQPTPLQHSVQLQGTHCGLNNGTASITETGGTGPYSYNWSTPAGSGNSAAGLAAGSYSLTVSDSQNCKDTLQFNISGSSGLVAAIAASSPVNCPGGTDGSATVTISNGTAPLSYVWSSPGNNTATALNLPAGMYTVTATDANLCTATATVTISAPAAFLHPTTITPALCGAPSGAVSINETGGTAPYQYVWSGGASGNPATNLGAGAFVVTITDQHGCQDTAHVTIPGTPAALAVVSAITPDNCFGGADGSATVALNSAAPPVAYNWSPAGGNAATATGLLAGNYQVTVTDSNGCTAMASATISQPPAFQPALNITPAACGSANGAVMITETGGTGPYVYNWPAGIGSGNSANGLASGTYFVTVSDSHACEDTVTIDIGNIGGVQTGNVTASPVSCFGGNNGSASITANSGTQPYTYTWSGGGGNAPMASGLTAGIYTVTVTDALQCIATATATVGTPAAFQHLVSLQKASCSLANGAATIAETGGTAPYTYSWSPNVASGNAATNLSAGVYMLTVNDQNACQDTIHLQIDSIPHVQAQIAATSSVACFGGNNGSASVLALQGTAPYSYAWSGGGGSSSSATGLSAGAYTVTVSDAGNCSAIVTVNISQSPALQHIVNAQAPTCGLSNGAVNLVESGGTPDYSYTWLPAGGNAASASNLPAGNYVVSVVDQKGCPDTAHVTLVNIPGVQAVVSSVTNVSCFGRQDGSATIGASVGALPYVYNWPAGNNMGPMATGLGAGVYTVTITDAHQCIATVAVTVTQPAVLDHSVAVVDAHCSTANGSATITAIGGTGPYVYQWFPSGGTASTAGNLLPGSYLVAVADQHGCLDTVALVVANLPGVTLNIISATEVSCFGSADGSATVMAAGGVPPYQYAWSPGGATTATVSGLSAGQVMVTVRDATGCVDTTETNIRSPLPIFNQLHSTPVRCFSGHDGTIEIDTTTGGTPPYQYSLNQTPQGSNTLFSSLEPGTYLVETEDARGCLALDTIHLAVPLQNSLNAGPDTLIYLGDQVLLSGQAAYPGQILHYAWTPSDELVCDSCVSTLAQPLATTIYTLTAIDVNGCVLSDQRQVIVRVGDIYIPNVILPGSDALNDRFTLYAGRGVDEIIDLQIYDRWGELVFENQHFPPSKEEEGWDGTYRGKALDPGVLVYFFRVRLIDGSETVLKGDVTVLR